jgi:acetolactate synthase I/III small subunit
MENAYVLSLTTENALRVLQKIATIFSRHRLNIEQLNVFETTRKGISHFNVMVHSKEHLILQVVKQLERIIEVKQVNINHRIPLSEEVV